MAKIVNCWNEWDPLKRIVVGRPEGSAIAAPEPGWMYNCAAGGVGLGYSYHYPQEDIDAANEQQNEFIKMLEKRGVIVHRVFAHPALDDDRGYATPDWTQVNAQGVNNPRDMFLPVGNEIMEAPGSRRARFFEYIAMRPLFEQWIKEDPEFLWTAAPKPRMTKESYVPNYFWDYEYVWDTETKRKKLLNWDFHLTEKEPMWDAADACRAGKDIFWLCSSVTNRIGMEWITRYLRTRGIRVHPIILDTSHVPYYHPWHIDCGFTLIRPGLCIIANKKPIYSQEIVELFKKNDWEIVEAVDPVYHWKDKITMSSTPQGRGMDGPNWISTNTLSLDPKTVCISDKETAYMEQLNKLGVEVVPVAYEKVYRFGGMIHCSTLDIYREGGLEDYYPNQ